MIDWNVILITGSYCAAVAECMITLVFVAFCTKWCFDIMDGKF